MHRTTKLAFLAAAFLLAVPFAVRVSAASPTADPVQAGHDQAQLESAEGQVSSIADRLKQLQSQAAEAAQQQQQATQKIAQLTAASEALLPKIEAQNQEVVRKRAALADAISHDYQRQPDSALMALAASGSVSETMAHAKYGEIVRNHVDRMAQDAQAAEDKLTQQKADYDARKRDAELAQRQLQDIAASVAAQQAESDELLANRSDEAAYLAKRVADAKSTQDKLLTGAGGNALWGTYHDGSQVSRGDVIGFEGSTGNSTGCHTHFSVIAGGHWVNPAPYIEGGTFRRPDGKITQGYGMTDWAKTGAYGGGIHNGIDFVQPCGASVHAAGDGTVIRDTRDNSGFGHYIMIRHADGLITLYGHLI